MSSRNHLVRYFEKHPPERILKYQEDIRIHCSHHYMKLNYYILASMKKKQEDKVKIPNILFCCILNGFISVTATTVGLNINT